MTIHHLGWQDKTRGSLFHYEYLIDIQSRWCFGSISGFLSRTIDDFKSLQGHPVRVLDDRYDCYYYKLYTWRLYSGGVHITSNDYSLGLKETGTASYVEDGKRIIESKILAQRTFKIVKGSLLNLL